ncbi:MAG: porin family protein [Roseivirga sp.]|nr:porin family protein [Roseivirga sp.]
MKLRLLLGAILMFGIAKRANAQLLVGGGPLYGDDIEEVGSNLRLYTFIGDKICFGPEFTAFGKHDTMIDGEQAELGLWEINFNGHYIFEVGEGLGLYPVAGLNYSKERETIEGHDDVVEDALGVNLGFGVHYELNRFILYTEYDRLFSDLRQNSFTVGILFHLGKKHETKKEGH